MSWGYFLASLLTATIVSGVLLYVARICNLNIPTWTRVLVFLLLHLLVSFPFSDIPLVGFVYAVSADLSVATFLLLSALLLKMLFSRAVNRAHMRTLALAVCMLAMPLYISVLYGNVQLYNSGFANNAVLAGIALVGLVALFTGFFAVALWIGLSCILWLLGAGESANLFDYLVDPLACSYGLYVVATWLVSTVSAYRQKKTE